MFARVLPTPVLALLLLVSLVAQSSALCGAELEPGSSSLHSFLPGYRVVRCMFEQGKLVLAVADPAKGPAEDRFLVLRKGDLVDEKTGLRVHDIRRGEAVLAQGGASSGDGGPGDSAVPARILKIRLDREGVVSVIELFAGPPVEAHPPVPFNPEKAADENGLSVARPELQPVQSIDEGGNS